MNGGERARADPLAAAGEETRPSLVARLFGPRQPDAAVGIASVVTATRLGVAMGLFVLAIRTGTPTYAYLGLGAHWLGDVADGFLARRLRQETILGAEIDLIADRVDMLFFFVIFLGYRPELYVPVFIYVLNFAFVDFFLGYQFTKYGIISPNYFSAVDHVVYRLNFSPPAKFVNGVPVPLLLILAPRAHLLAAVMAVALLGVKGYSVVRLRRVVVPAPRSD